MQAANRTFAAVPYYTRNPFKRRSTACGPFRENMRLFETAEVELNDRLH